VHPEGALGKLTEQTSPFDLEAFFKESQHVLDHLLEREALPLSFVGLVGEDPQLLDDLRGPFDLTENALDLLSSCCGL